MVLLLVDVATSSNPVSMGVRTALASSTRRIGASSKSKGRRSLQLFDEVWSASKSSRPEGRRAAEDAFYSTHEEAEQLGCAEYAFRRAGDSRIWTNCAANARSVPATVVRAPPTVKPLKPPVVDRPLAFWENMICGAISRSVAQTVMHPANTMKTMLQNAQGPSMLELLQPRYFRRLTNGAGANFLLSVPHGAVNFAILELVRKRLAGIVDGNPRLSANAERLGPGLDFMSSAISTIITSVVSTPQMMITDNIMAGNYNNLFSAVRGLALDRGIAGFYSGWWPGLVGKIPSYALTWTFFQQLKVARDKVTGRAATDLENSVMGCIASGTTVCLMIPMDTIKTRLVTRSGAYKGIIDCAVRVAREEGIGAFYRGLPPRLISVVPMIGIQFGVYEFMRKTLAQRQVTTPLKGKAHEEVDQYLREKVLEEAAMEVAASPEHPYPAPQFLKRVMKKKKENRLRWGVAR